MATVWIKLALLSQMNTTDSKSVKSVSMCEFQPPQESSVDPGLSSILFLYNSTAVTHSSEAGLQDRICCKCTFETTSNTTLYSFMGGLPDSGGLRLEGRHEKILRSTVCASHQSSDDDQIETGKNETVELTVWSRSPERDNGSFSCLLLITGNIHNINCSTGPHVSDVKTSRSTDQSMTPTVTTTTRTAHSTTDQLASSTTDNLAPSTTVTVSSRSSTLSHQPKGLHSSSSTSATLFISTRHAVNSISPDDAHIGDIGVIMLVVGLFLFILAVMISICSVAYWKRKKKRAHRGRERMRRGKMELQDFKPNFYEQISDVDLKSTIHQESNSKQQSPGDGINSVLVEEPSSVSGGSHTKRPPLATPGTPSPVSIPRRKNSHDTDIDVKQEDDEEDNDYSSLNQDAYEDMSVEDPPQSSARCDFVQKLCTGINYNATLRARSHDPPQPTADIYDHQSKDGRSMSLDSSHRFNSAPLPVPPHGNAAHCRTESQNNNKNYDVSENKCNEDDDDSHILYESVLDGHSPEKQVVRITLHGPGPLNGRDKLLGQTEHVEDTYSHLDREPPLQSHGRSTFDYCDLKYSRISDLRDRECLTADTAGSFQFSGPNITSIEGSTEENTPHGDYKDIGKQNEHCEENIYEEWECNTSARRQTEEAQKESMHIQVPGDESTMLIDCVPSKGDVNVPQMFNSSEVEA